MSMVNEVLTGHGHNRGPTCNGSNQTHYKLLGTVMKFSILRLLAVFVLASAFLSGPAFADAGFKKWKRGFAAYAAKKGIRRSTFNRAFKGINSADPEVLKLARYQPEFRNKLWMYFDSRVNDQTIQLGRDMKRKWGKWLSRFEKKYGIDKHILLAIWSMESGYGAAMEKQSSLRSVIRSLATLSYADRKRRRFANSQLIGAMKILQSGRITTAELRGSWAGAMGHTQFIPTSYIAFAQDADGDGRKDIWRSVPDALATAANLLKRNGWRPGKTWGYEVKVPARAVRLANKTRSVGAWRKLGVKRINGKPFPRNGDRAVLKFPAGRSGPAFLMLKNFYVIKRYNNSDKYALAVGHLADRIAGYKPFIKTVPRPYRQLSIDERIELQSLLAKAGLYNAGISGTIGPKTRAAIKKAQLRYGLKADGYESPKLLKRLRQG